MPCEVRYVNRIGRTAPATVDIRDHVHAADHIHGNGIGCGDKMSHRIGDILCEWNRQPAAA